MLEGGGDEGHTGRELSEREERGAERGAEREELREKLREREREREREQLGDSSSCSHGGALASERRR